MFAAIKRFSFLRKFINPEFNIIQITRAVIIAQLLLMLFSYPLVDINRYITLNSYIYIILINLILFSTIFFKDLKCKQLFLVMCWFFIFWINIRIISFLYQTSSNLEFIHPKFFTKLEIENALLFIFIANFFIILGIFLGKYINLPKLKLNLSDQIYNFKNQFFIWVSVILVFWFINIYLGTSIYSTPDKWGSKWGFLQSLFNPDTILIVQIITMFVLFKNKKPVIFQTLFVIFGILIYFLLSTYQGSRGGTFKIINMLILVLIAFSPYYKIRFSSFLLIFIILPSLNVLSFNYGTSIRYLIGQGLDINEINVQKRMKQEHAVALRGHWTAPELTPEEQDIYDNVFKNKDYKVFKKVTFEIASLLNNKEFVVPTRAVMTRMNLFDYVVIIKNFEKDEKKAAKYFRSTYAIQNFINNIVPGEIFLDATIKTNRLFSYLYRGFGLDEIQEYFQSEPFTIYGLSLLMGNQFNLLIVFSFAFIFRAMFSIIPDSNNVTNTSFNFFYIIFWALMLSSFGMDNFLTVAAHSSASLCFMIALFYVLKKVFDIALFKKVNQ